jgi:hypothetical protein
LDNQASMARALYVRPCVQTKHTAGVLDSLITCTTHMQPTSHHTRTAGHTGTNDDDTQTSYVYRARL